MGRRIDYHRDPNAPAANSVRPSAGAFVEREGAVLLIRRSDNGNRSMPGGAHDPGESPSHTAVRETLEETGSTVRLTGLVAGGATSADRYPSGV
ncbi:NUDIX domain-containing protein [Nocardia puris]|uniref:NUDIX domain-containing protein n=1 Tax=Nocardia puris TaxID=208602 RepID=A0A366DX76_9NOCA|nr:NUDIX domain-containing protein [Nocardia puris]MBF6210122.1 NUDIX domain-containing protein [Nocardia puris]MBF6368313.1 NUDIX domain-containing protein [Nocardia puris]MBF6457969.1 NUDIX domain-containing protein [Nocardia puris]RBO94129.1 NUDIX domain-containing protein [Nocardia puris]